jgi:hypothetical protein
MSAVEFIPNVCWVEFIYKEENIFFSGLNLNLVRPLLTRSIQQY